VTILMVHLFLLRVRDLPNGLIVHVGTFGHLCRVKSFKKAVSTVMDDLELYYSIIEQLAPVIFLLIILCSKLAQLQQQT
jgi:hypothetical protein